jgi:hypothetical protein
MSDTNKEKRVNQIIVNNEELYNNKVLGNNLLNELEKKGEKECINLMSTNNGKSIEKVIEGLQNIMSEGSKEFKAKTGREMTYSEMRQMYG